MTSNKDLTDKHDCIHSQVDDYDQYNSGLPALDLNDKPLGPYEFWPSWFFYLPVVFYWIFLSVKYRSFSLPMLSNPRIDLGGMVGESKSEILDLAEGEARDFILPYVLEQRTKAYDSRSLEELLLKAEKNDIIFPMIVKPDLGCRGAGVQKVDTREALEAYIDSFPVGRAFMLQQLAPFSAEVGLFYQRMPNETKGRITSLTLKYAPYVIGDGHSTLKQLIENDPRASELSHLYIPKNQGFLGNVIAKGECRSLAFAGSHSRGSIFRNGERYISSALESKIDELMHRIPDFHYGRMDIKFKDMASFMKGENFAIIEINGASSESTHIWDSRTRLKDIFIVLLKQYKTLFAMGDQIRQRGVKTPSISRMIRTWLEELKAVGDLPPSN